MIANPTTASTDDVNVTDKSLAENNKNYHHDDNNMDAESVATTKISNVSGIPLVGIWYFKFFDILMF